MWFVCVLVCLRFFIVSCLSYDRIERTQASYLSLSYVHLNGRLLTGHVDAALVKRTIISGSTWPIITMWNSDVQPDVELGICQPSQRIDGAGTGASRERPTPPPHQDVELGFFSDSLFHDSAHDLGGVSDGRSALSQDTHTHTSTVWEEQARNSEFSKPNGTDWREEEEERQRWSLDSGRRETMDTPILRSEGGKLLSYH